MRLGIACLLVMAVQSLSAFGGTAGVLVKVSGDIAPVPRFVDDEGVAISVLTFSFEGMAKETSEESVDSVPVSFRLVGAASYPAQVSFQRPKGCSIGTEGVSDTNVLLQANGTVFANDGDFAVPSTSAVSVGLRFAQASALSGSVSCNSDGGFVYSY